MGFFKTLAVGAVLLATPLVAQAPKPVAATASASPASPSSNDGTTPLHLAVRDNDIAKVHQQFLNDGGLGILVGDGMLPHPGPEQIIETYYAFPLLASTVT